MSFNASGSKYLRSVPCITDGKIDVYAVLDAFAVTCPARQHAIKKLLCTGIRGKGDPLQDLKEAADAITRAIQMQQQKADWYEPAPRHDEFLSGLCPSCQRKKPCRGDYPATSDGGCEGYIQPPITVPPPERKPSLCWSCDIKNCSKERITECEETCGCSYYQPALRERMPDAKEYTDITLLAETAIRALCYTRDHVGPERLPAIAGWEWYDACKKLLPLLPTGSKWAEEFQSRVCENGGRMLDAEAEAVATAKQDTPKTDERPLDFTLPPITIPCSAEEAQRKFVSEVSEWRAAEKGSLHEMVERWDCLQALNTYFQRNGDAEWYQTHAKGVMDDLARWHAEGRDVMEARAATLRKNAAREYYSKGVNDAINLSGGFSFTPKEADA